MAVALTGLFLVLTALTVIGRFNLWPSRLPDPLVSGKIVEGEKHDTLFVLVHGLAGGPDQSWSGARAALYPYGDLLLLSYPASTLSNADPNDVALGVSTAVQAAVAERPYKEVVLVGHSMGALIARKAFLYARGATDVREGEASTIAPWASKVTRIVLLAGTNRGWDISGQKPSDMGWGRYLEFWIGSWFGRLTGSGRLILAMETGAPFVANLRLEWMQWFRREGVHKPHVVQLLGDIDDVVSDADNKDLRAAPSPNFTWLRVRGTGHLDILDFDDQSFGLGAYRRDKFLLAARAPVDQVRRENEEQPFETDDKVTHVVFILHGIRDLGRWSAGFERALLTRFLEGAKTDEKLAIASVRYGYFGMGQFILRPGRQKYVRWFMDQYTETLARYPNVRRVDFVGHSNGTYLLTSALERYRSLKVDRIVFAGSVVRTDFNWKSIFEREQVKRIRNYVASGDWVVALFPRFFEHRLLRFLGNDIGSAGFNGFAGPNTPSRVTGVENIEFITGKHSAFLRHVPSIVDFLLPPKGTASVIQTGPRHGVTVVLKFVSDWASWFVWLLLATLVVWVGIRAAGAAGELAWFVVVSYIALVLLILRLA